MSGLPAQRAAPNPAVAAYFRSTAWKLLIAADIAAAILSVALYLLTKSIFAFAPIVLVGLFLAFTLVRLTRSNADAASGGEDQLVQ
jgi:hypothetical protein